MGLFDIIGPIMVGPSSSHTAGAVRIGYVTRQLLGEDIAEAQIDLYGSFLATGRGHGTDRALVAGLLGMKEDDYRIPRSFEIAKEKGMRFQFGEALLKEAHPNSVQITVTGVDGKERTIVGSSIGGGSIRICKIDDIETNFTGDYTGRVIYMYKEDMKLSPHTKSKLEEYLKKKEQGAEAHGISVN
ncbi:MAG: L-serine ammonia-lyase, iron-sulfur-dependent subunit beta [Lachnospiraceae bacterium]|nr:L-serine ammonia-lyase, iron-sulfur-dependent subunit beta [Lachnospiraceae bacterium]